MRTSLLLLPLLVACGGELVFVGDSHTAGACTDTPCAPYVEVAARQLAGIYSTRALGFPGVPMVVIGLNPEFFAREIAPHVAAARVSLMAGSNDARYGFPTSWYRAAAARAVDRLYAAGAQRVALSPPPPPGWPEPAPLLASYRAAALELCRLRHDLDCGPDSWSFLRPEDFAGGVHMNARGHRRLGRAFGWYWIAAALVDCQTEARALRF
jgi:hypothetical protein